MPAPPDAKLAERVRRALAHRSDVTEKRMVGGLSFLVGEKMCCGVTGDALMVRVGADGMKAALARPNVRPMVLGKKPLKAFVCVEPAGCRTDKALAAWIARGVECVASLPGRG